MFGVLVSGRLVDTNFQQAAASEFVLALEQVENVNHVVVFLTGQVPFAEGFGGSIYFGWPGGSSVSWQLLGFISNDKPSAIFKLAKVKPSGVSVSPFGTGMMDTVGVLASTTALIGVQVQPLTELLQQTPSADTQASTVESFTEFSQKMLENFYNFASSFSVNPSQFNPSETYIPASVLTQWYASFQRRLQFNPHFWKSL